MAKKKGVYSIRNMVTGKTYIGSSKDVTARLCGHRQLLRKGKHHLDDMIADWKEYGEASFEFKLVERVHDDYRLLSREEFWIKETICSRTLCYNKIIDVGRFNRTCLAARVDARLEMRILCNRNAQAAMILMFFMEHMDEENQVSCTHGFMQRYFSCSRYAIQRSVRALLDDGYVSISKVGAFNVYNVNDDVFSIAA